MSRGIAIIYKAKKYLNIQSLIQLYSSFILPYLIYCVEIWGNTSMTYLDPIHKLQRKVLKIITHSKKSTPRTVLFKKMDVLPFNLLTIHRIGILMHKIHFKNAPKCIQDMFKTNCEFHKHDTRNKNHLRTQNSKREYIHNTFSYQSIYVWNMILSNLDIYVSFAKFKKVLKAFLQSSSFALRYSR